MTENWVLHVIKVQSNEEKIWSAMVIFSFLAKVKCSR